MALFPTVEKVCKTCHEPKPLMAFGKQKAMKDGLRPQCKECRNAEGRKYYRENKEYRLAQSAEWQRNNPDKRAVINKRCREKNLEKHKARGKRYLEENREKVLARRKKYYQKNRTKLLEEEKQRRFSSYGITQGDYDDLMAKQEGLCPICERSLFEGTQINIDHCHSTGKVRGLLHNKCNMLLGLAGDDLNLFYNAIRYLAECRMPEENSNKILKMEN